MIDRIIPSGVTVAAVKDFQFKVRLMADYDATFLQDRLRADVFVNDQPVGVYSSMRVGDEFSRYGRQGLEEAMRTFGPDLERSVADEFMGLGYRQKVRDLETQLLILEAHINRVRWWQVRRRWAARKAS